MESWEKVVEFYYVEAKCLFWDVCQGEDWLVVCWVYVELDCIWQYFSCYWEVEQLQEEVLYLGMMYILVSMWQEVLVAIFNVFEWEFIVMAVQDLNSQWKVYYICLVEGLYYDYEVVMCINCIEISFGLVCEWEYEEIVVVEDGWEYVLDVNGNVVKDFLGNDIMQFWEVMVWVLILENYQNKMVWVSGWLEFVDCFMDNLIYIEFMFVEAVFENYVVIFWGDKWVLSKQFWQWIGNQLVFFLSEEMLLLQVVEWLKFFVKWEIVGVWWMI